MDSILSLIKIGAVFYVGWTLGAIIVGVAVIILIFFLAGIGSFIDWIKERRI